eukprot:5009639-Prymnesium_polylepis.1
MRGCRCHDTCQHHIESHNLLLNVELGSTMYALAIGFNTAINGGNSNSIACRAPPHAEISH